MESMKESKPIKVLMIEDNPADARLMKEVLGGEGPGAFDLEGREELSTGLQRIDEGGIDVVLLDLNLPDSRGLDSFARTILKAPQIPIVVLTSLDDEALATRAVRNGAQDYLVKGKVDHEQVARALRYAVARGASARDRQQIARETKRLALISGELDVLEGAFTVAQRVEQAAAEPLMLPGLAEVLASFEWGIRRHCVAEEKAYLQAARAHGGAEKAAASLLLDHHRLLGELRQMYDRARELASSDQDVTRDRPEVKEYLASMRLLLEAARKHADMEEEFQFKLSHSS
ncbi:MAG: response regulator [Chloroflexi bacterium]|nr:response regulator [Chloroflexota bacterium]